MYTSIKDILKHESKLEKCSNTNKFLNKGALPEHSDIMDDYLEINQGDICNPDADMQYVDYSCNKTPLKTNASKSTPIPTAAPVPAPYVNDNEPENVYEDDENINFFPDDEGEEEEMVEVESEDEDIKRRPPRHDEYNLFQKYGLTFITGGMILVVMLMTFKHANQ
jgi:hypothetical protein